MRSQSRRVRHVIHADDRTNGTIIKCRHYRIPRIELPQASAMPRSLVPICQDVNRRATTESDSKCCQGRLVSILHIRRLRTMLGGLDYEYLHQDRVVLDRSPDSIRRSERYRASAFIGRLKFNRL